MNTVSLTGRLTRDPELRTLPSGEPVCSMRIAVDQMGRGDQAGYINITSFGPSGKACADTLTQGWLVAVDGRLDFHQWTGSDDKPRSAIEVIGRVEFLAAPKAQDTGAPDREPAGAAA
jgi:single-strand DNA-binding protein